MNKEFIPYEQALELRHLGFDGESIFYWTNGNNGYYVNNGDYHYTNDHWMFTDNDHKGRDKMCVAPLYQQAFRWFREKYKMHFFAQYFTDGKWRGTHSKEDFNTYEEAELACLKKLIEIAKQQ